MANIVTSVQVEAVGGHDRVKVWNRGGLAGELVVQLGDGEPICERLRGGDARAWGVAGALEKIRDRLVRVVTLLGDTMTIGKPLERRSVLDVAIPEAVIELGDLVTSIGDEALAAWKRHREAPKPLTVTCAWCLESLPVEGINNHVFTCASRTDHVELQLRRALQTLETLLLVNAQAPCAWDPMEATLAECTVSTPCRTHKLIATLSEVDPGTKPIEGVDFPMRPGVPT